MCDLNVRLSFRGRVFSQAISRRPFTENARLRFRAKLCDIRGAQSGTGTGFLRALRSCCRYRCTIAPMLHNRLHVSTNFIRRTKGRNSVNLKPSSVSNTEEKSSLPLSCQCLQVMGVQHIARQAVSCGPHVVYTKYTSYCSLSCAARKPAHNKGCGPLS